jgi:hypothetical protein
MSRPLVVSIPHRLGKGEALRRLKNGLRSASANFGHVFKVEEQIWTGSQLQYRISALGQVASRSIDVAEDYVSVGGVSALAPGEARRNTAGADPQGRDFVIGKEIEN